MQSASPLAARLSCEHRGRIAGSGTKTIRPSPSSSHVPVLDTSAISALRELSHDKLPANYQRKFSDTFLCDQLPPAIVFLWNKKSRKVVTDIS